MTADTAVRSPEPGRPGSGGSDQRGRGAVPGGAGQAPGLLHRIAGWSMRHAGLAVLIWVLTLVAVTVGSSLVGNDYRNDNSLPGTDSQRVIDAFREHAPEGSPDSVQIVLHDEGGVARAETRTAVSSMLAEVRKLGHVAAVADPYAVRGSISADGRTAYSTVQLSSAGERFRLRTCARSSRPRSGRPRTVSRSR